MQKVWTDEEKSVKLTSPENYHKKVDCLKVKSDPQDVTPEERKSNVKRLAGAISHSLRGEGEVSVRAFGFSAIGKAVKALAISRNYLKMHNLNLSCSPAFITAQIGENNLTGMAFMAFASDSSEEDIDMEKCPSILRVKADTDDMDMEEKKISVKKLAMAINRSLEENQQTVVRCFGSPAISKAAKALAIARGLVATRGPDMYCYPKFITANINGAERTGMAFITYTNG